MLTLSVEKRSAAFCLVDRNNRVRNLAGNLEIYGLGDIKEGQCVEGRMPFLHCLSAEDREPVFLPRIEIAQGVYADIHIITNETGMWVVFLDATDKTESLQAMRQQVNETYLQLEEANKTIAKLQKEIDSLK